MKMGIRRSGYSTMLDIVWPHEDWRGAQADMHRLAAEIEERSRDERWVVNVPGGVGSLGKGRLGGVVGLELADGSEAEFARAEALLSKIAAEWTTR